jgi:hypothetical protein
VRPPAPVGEQRLDPGQAAWLADGSKHDLLGHDRFGVAQHRDLQGLFGVKVGKEAGFRSLQVLGEHAEGEALQPLDRGDAGGLGDDRLASGFSTGGHAGTLRPTGRTYKRHRQGLVPATTRM